MDGPPRHLNRGYLKVFRSLFDGTDPFWAEDRPRTNWEAWLWILYATHWDTRPGEVTVRGNVVPIHSGEVYLSRRTFAKKMVWTERKARTFLNLTRSMTRIAPTERSAYGIHHVCNYCDYCRGGIGEAPAKRPAERPAERPAKRPAERPAERPEHLRRKALPSHDYGNAASDRSPAKRPAERPAERPQNDPLPIMKHGARRTKSDSSLSPTPKDPSFWQVVKGVEAGTITHGIYNGVAIRALLGNDGKGVVLDPMDGHSVPIRVYSPKQAESIDWLPSPDAGLASPHERSTDG